MGSYAWVRAAGGTACAEAESPRSVVPVCCTCAAKSVKPIRRRDQREALTERSLGATVAGAKGGSKYLSAQGRLAGFHAALRPWSPDRLARFRWASLLSDTSQDHRSRVRRAGWRERSGQAATFTTLLCSPGTRRGGSSSGVRCREVEDQSDRRNQVRAEAIVVHESLSRASITGGFRVTTACSAIVQWGHQSLASREPS